MMETHGDLACATGLRRDRLQRHPKRNGIDFLEVGGTDALRQRVLHVHFVPKTTQKGRQSLSSLLNKLAANPQNVAVEGGVRTQGIRVTRVERAGDRLDVEVSEPGDFSTYLLVLRDDWGLLDPDRSAVAFSFKAACPTRFDCKPVARCDAPAGEAPPIDYLAKDYASFRQGMLDLLPTLHPDWTERHEADLGIALVDLLAYVGDHLSYYQDAVANEAYLETARQRISVRRHARLVDYRMHDGASARAFVHVRVRDPADVPGFPEPHVLPASTLLLTRVAVPVGRLPAPIPVVVPGDLRLGAVAAADAAFETMEEARLHHALNEIPIHPWGDEECCLPQGATRADLRGDLQGLLRPGDWLLFEERVSPQEDNPHAADPERRQVVRLTRVAPAEDPVPPKGWGASAVKLTRVEWDEADALEFPFCVSSRDREGNLVENVTVARGNLALAAHGVTAPPEVHAGPVAPPSEVQRRAHRFKLLHGPLSFWPPVPDGPAAALRATGPHEAEPQVRALDVATPGLPLPGWRPRAHLLDSGPFDRSFAVETDDRGHAHLRFGDGAHGMEPPDGAVVQVVYRVGLGAAGNVGADALAHVVSDAPMPFVEAVRNPLPAWGGVDPEPVERVKRLAPAMLATGLRRAVTEEDYARAAETHPEVAKAVATFRKSRSWTTVFLTVDRKGGAEVDADFEASVRRHVERVALAGRDVEVEPPIHVPLEIDVKVCAHRDHFRADVERDLLEALGSGVRRDGRKAFFHPDRWTFGQPLHLSRLYAAIEGVPGVDSAEVVKVRRFWTGEEDDLSRGVVSAERLEILQAQSDPNFPGRGGIRLDVGGGR